jgi:hypothetical protein
VLKGGILKMDVAKKVQEAGLILGGLGVIGFIGIVWLMIYGNLSGNLGFSTGTAGYNNTEAVINNLTQGFGTFFGFSNTFFTIAAIVLLIFMLVGLLSIVMMIAKGNKKGDSGYSGY